MPRRKANVRTERTTRAPGRYSIGELTDVASLEAWLLRASTSTRTRVRMVHGS